MDPFSIVVGITGLICFGTRVTTAARDLFRNWTDAPEGVNQALQDVESLVDLLRDLKEFFNVSNLQNSKAAADERHKFRPVVKQCENVLKELEFVVKAYVDMKSPLSRNLRWARGGKQYYESIGRMIEPLKSTLMCKLALTRWNASTNHIHANC